MSYSIVKKIKFEKNGVSFLSACNNVYPREYSWGTYMKDLNKNEIILYLIRNTLEGNLQGAATTKYLKLGNRIGEYLLSIKGINPLMWQDGYPSSSDKYCLQFFNQQGFNFKSFDDVREYRKNDSGSIEIDNLYIKYHTHINQLMTEALTYISNNPIEKDKYVLMKNEWLWVTSRYTLKSRTISYVEEFTDKVKIYTIDKNELDSLTNALKNVGSGNWKFIKLTELLKNQKYSDIVKRMLGLKGVK